MFHINAFDCTCNVHVFNGDFYSFLVVVKGGKWHTIIQLAVSAYHLHTMHNYTVYGFYVMPTTIYQDPLICHDLQVQIFL